MKLEIESDNSHILGWQQRPLRYFPSARDIHMEKDAINASMDTVRILIQSLTWDAGSWISKKLS